MYIDAFSVTVSASGLPADSKGRPIAIGLTDSATAKGLMLELTVTRATVDTGKVAVNFTASMLMTFPDQTTATLTGRGTEVYVQAGPQLTYSSRVLLSGNVGDWMVTVDLQDSATVSR